MRKIGAEFVGYIGNIYLKKTDPINGLNEVLNAIIGISNNFYKIDNDTAKNNKEAENSIGNILKFD